jgi:hypothetical protein
VTDDKPDLGWIATVLIGAYSLSAAAMAAVEWIRS